MVTKIFITLLIIFPFIYKANAASLEEEKSFIEYYTKETFQTRSDVNKLNTFVAQSEIFKTMRQKARVSSLTNDERQILRESWAKLIQSHVTLNVIISKINERINENKDNALISDEYFTVLYAAYMSEYRSSIEFIRSMRTVPTTDKVLNEADQELGIDSRSFADFKLEYLNLAKFTQYSGYKIQAMTKKVETSELAAGIAEDESNISKFHHYKGTLYTLKNAGRITAHLLFKAYFPIQKNISEWMGDERVARGNEFLINQNQIKTIHQKLKSGDVFIERREWYLSNIGLPGFWPHAALYLGRPEERSYLEEDESVQEWVKSEGIESGSFEELLANKHPQAYKESLGSDDSHHEYRVLEAMSEGVVYTSLEHSANADSLAVLRPRLANLDIAKGILTSLKYQGRPYDFNFDFRTDSTVVCSELIYYTYQPTKDKNGLYFPVTETLGRPVVTPNNIVKDFVESYGTDKQQYDLIVFLDGNDKKKEAVFSGIDMLKTTPGRPKWFIFTQNKKH
ncbi:MAG: hypothetical protein H7177_12325 [Rhizobacter sp.]|nr:hypothetical protein [Bacteriovorax sp.]